MCTSLGCDICAPVSARGLCVNGGAGAATCLERVCTWERFPRQRSSRPSSTPPGMALWPDATDRAALGWLADPREAGSSGAIRCPWAGSQDTWVPLPDSLRLPIHRTSLFPAFHSQVKVAGGGTRAGATVAVPSIPTHPISPATGEGSRAKLPSSLAPLLMQDSPECPCPSASSSQS